MSELTPLSIAERPVNEGLVLLLEDLLARVKTGEIVAFAGVSLFVGREFGEHCSNVEANAMAFLGYVRVLQMRIERMVDM